MTAEEARTLLSKSIRAGRLAQAYILVGDPRLDAAQVAEDCAAMLFCSSAKPPCEVCAMCRQARARTHADMMWVEPVQKSRIISVKQVREVNMRMTQTSFAGGWKVCIIGAADRMQKPAANALLKTLEEPPGRSVFFLLTSQPQALLPTVLSRCQRLSVGGIGTQLEAGLLGRVDGMLEKAMAAPSGRIQGTAAALVAAAELNAVVKDLKTRAEEEVEAEEGGKEADEPGNGEMTGLEVDDEVREARIGARYRELRAEIVRFVNEWARDLLALTAAGPDAPLLDDRRRERLSAIAQRLGHAGVMSGIRAIDEMTGLFETNMLELVVLENALCSLSAGAPAAGGRPRQGIGAAAETR